MANSYIEYDTGLTETTYDIPFKYISISDVDVKGYDGSDWSDLAVASRSSTDNTVTLVDAPSASQKIRVWRNTSTSQLVDFQNGSRLSERDLDTAYQQGLFVAQEVSENASTVVESAGPQGPQGVQGNAGTNGVLSQFFESTEQDLVNGIMRISVEHNLGSTPKLFQAVLRCKQSEGGYSVGDEYDCSNPTYVTSTHVAFSSFSALSILRKTITTSFTPSVTHWKIVLRAFA